MVHTDDSTSNKLFISLILFVFNIVCNGVNTLMHDFVENVDIIGKLMSVAIQLLSGTSLCLIIFINFGTAKSKFKEQIGSLLKPKKSEDK